MQSPKNSSKHSLVTYGSDISDEEVESVSNIPLPARERSNDASDMRSMDISPITNDSKSGYSNEPTPKERNIEIAPSKKRKATDSNIGGLVSYPMDDDDNFHEEDEDDSEPYLHFVHDKESSNEKDHSHHNLVSVDNDECFNAEGRESDIENDDSNRPAGEIDLKSRSGQSSSTVKAIVLTKRPKGSELAYLLSRQILSNRGADIHLPALATTKPPHEHEQRILELRAKANNSPWSTTQSILHNKEYRNPSIYEKLIEHMKIDERGTNYPPELYDPYRFGEESYYEVLARAQDAAERKRLEQGGSGTTTKSAKPISTKNSEMRMRKTKWDTGSKPQVTKSSNSGVVIETKTMFPIHK